MFIALMLKYGISAPEIEFMAKRTRLNYLASTNMVFHPDGNRDPEKVGVYLLLFTQASNLVFIILILFSI